MGEIQSAIEQSNAATSTFALCRVLVSTRGGAGLAMGSVSCARGDLCIILFYTGGAQHLPTMSAGGQKRDLEIQTPDPTGPVTKLRKPGQAWPVPAQLSGA